MPKAIDCNRQRTWAAESLPAPALSSTLPRHGQPGSMKEKSGAPAFTPNAFNSPCSHLFLVPRWLEV
jgi:hypothetical protein